MAGLTDAAVDRLTASNWRVKLVCKDQKNIGFKFLMAIWHPTASGVGPLGGQKRKVFEYASSLAEARSVRRSADPVQRVCIRTLGEKNGRNEASVGD